MALCVGPAVSTGNYKIKYLWNCIQTSWCFFLCQQKRWTGVHERFMLYLFILLKCSLREREKTLPKICDRLSTSKLCCKKKRSKFPNEQTTNFHFPCMFTVSDKLQLIVLDLLPSLHENPYFQLKRLQTSDDTDNCLFTAQIYSIHERLFDLNQTPRLSWWRQNHWFWTLHWVLHYNILRVLLLSLCLTSSYGIQQRC